MSYTYVYYHELTRILLDWLDSKYPGRFRLGNPQHHYSDHDRIENANNGYELMHIGGPYVYLFRHDPNEKTPGMGMLASDKLYAADLQFFNKIKTNIESCLYYRRDYDFPF